MASLGLNLSDCVVIVVQNGEPRPQVINAFSESAVRWVATCQPELLQLVVRALRLAGDVDETLDGLNVAAGGDRGHDAAWLETWASVKPEEPKRLRVVQGGEAA